MWPHGMSGKTPLKASKALRVDLNTHKHGTAQHSTAQHETHTTLTLTDGRWGGGRRISFKSRCEEVSGAGRELRGLGGCWTERGEWRRVDYGDHAMDDDTAAALSVTRV